MLPAIYENSPFLTTASTAMEKNHCHAGGVRYALIPVGRRSIWRLGEREVVGIQHFSHRTAVTHIPVFVIQRK
ncbi:MAG: hypothetical protein JXA46_18480 [Dehalococcoidales bacterium]|nr:hypothetical protein [Dehalococcoidales bacterium]